LKQVAALLEEGLRPAPQQVERWFARFMTEPKPHLVRSREGEAVSAATLREAARKGRRAKHALGSRWAFIVDKNGIAGAKGKVHLFVEGHEWIVPASLTSQIATLCDLSQVSLAECAALFGNAGSLKAVRDLFALGLLEWADDKRPQPQRRRAR
jgi:hypothetical protein